MNALEKRADRLFSEFIRNRDGGCQMAEGPGGRGCFGRLECAHLIRRGFKATRWDPRNAVALCAGHHGWMTNHPLAWADWRQERLGASWPELLRKAYGGPKPDVAAIVEQLREAG